MKPDVSVICVMGCLQATTATQVIDGSQLQEKWKVKCRITADQGREWYCFFPKNSPWWTSSVTAMILVELTLRQLVHVGQSLMHCSLSRQNPGLNSCASLSNLEQVCLFYITHRFIFTNILICLYVTFCSLKLILLLNSELFYNTRMCRWSLSLNYRWNVITMICSSF